MTGRSGRYRPGPLGLLPLLTLPVGCGLLALGCGAPVDAAGTDALVSDAGGTDDALDGDDHGGDVPGVHAVTQTATLSKAAVVLDEAASVTVSTSEDALVFAGTDRADLAALQPGAVLVGTAGRGFLRRVESVSSADGQTTVHTSPATLEDLFDEASFSLELPLDGPPPAPGAPAGAQPQPPCWSCAAAPWLGADLTGTVLYENREGEGANQGFVRATLSPATMTLAPRLSFDYTKSFLSGVHFLSFEAKGQFQAALGLDVAFSNAALEGKHELTLASQTFRLMVGTVPVLVTPELSVVLEGTMIHNGGFCRVRAGVQLVGDFDAATTFDSEREPQWDGWSGGYADLSALPFQVSGDWSAAGSVTLAARLKVSVKIYDVAGPYVDLGPSATLAFNYGLPDPPADLVAPGTWDISGATQFRVGVEASILGHDLFDYNRVFPLSGGPIATGELDLGECDRDAAEACAGAYTNADDEACAKACIADAACPTDPVDYVCAVGVMACTEGECLAERWAHRQSCFGASACEYIGAVEFRGTPAWVGCQRDAAEGLASCIRAHEDLYVELMKTGGVDTDANLCRGTFWQDVDQCDELLRGEGAADLLGISLPEPQSTGGW